MKLGEIIKAYREEHDQSQRNFAAACGLSNGYISMLENGTNGYNDTPMVPKLTALKKISDAMGISLNDLIAEMDDMPVSLAVDDEAPVTSSSDERDVEFLSLFRRLSDDEQILLLRQMRGLLAGR